MDAPDFNIHRRESITFASSKVKPTITIDCKISSVFRIYPRRQRCICPWLLISINPKTTSKFYKRIFIRSHEWNLIIFMFDDFNFIINPIKKEWLPRHNIFAFWPTPLTFFARSVFPSVWIVASNYWIEICLHQCDGFILV